MKTYEEKPIPLIFLNSQKKYEVNPEALQFFNSLQGKVAVISVAGIYRTGRKFSQFLGKSFLLNKIILNTPSGFAVGPTTNAKTKGIWVWGKPLISHNENDQIINVIVLDSEGLGSTQEDINHDLKLFSITLLMSSAFLYNTVGSIDENAIDSLGLVLRLCEHLKSESYNDFPDFYWILRDFSLALVDKDGKSLSTKQYLQNCLSPQPGDSQIRNRIRNSIRESFTSRSCCTFVRPLTDQNSLQKLDKMELDELRPEFVQEVIDFRKLIFQSLKNKTIKGKEIKGEMLSDLISLYVAEINGDKIPVIQTGWKYVCLKQCENAMEDVEKKLGHKISQMSSQLPQTKADFLFKKQQAQNELLRLFMQRTKNNDQREQSLAELKATISKSFSKLQQEMIQKNTQETKNFIRKQFESVQKRFKSGEFSSIAELSKQFEVFYEYFRKKCPYKDNIQVGLEYLLKKFADCSLIIYKSMRTKKESEINSLKEELTKVTNAGILKDEKYKCERQKLNDKLTITESALSNLQTLHKQCISTINEYETQVQRLKQEMQETQSSHESESELEKISLKKKIMLLQEQLRESSSSKGLELSNLRNTISLKQNQLKHLAEEKATINDKLTQTMKLLNKMKDQKSSSVYELTIELENERTIKDNLYKEYENKLNEKSKEISKLQNYLESKVTELQSLKQEQMSLSQHRSEAHEAQKIAIKSQFQQKLSELQESKAKLQDVYKLSSSKLNQQLEQKQMDFKMLTMETQKEKAILEQKIEFLRRELQQKQEKITKLSNENRCYLDMFDEKDNEIAVLNNQIDLLRHNHHSTNEQYQTKFIQFSQELKKKQKQIMSYEQQNQNLQQSLKSINSQFQALSEKHNALSSSSNQIHKTLKAKIQQLTSELQQKKTFYQTQIQELNMENTKNLEEQKKNIERSITQLKNYYEMEKERLEKRILEDRKKHQYSEEEKVAQLQDLMKKQHKAHLEETNALRTQVQTLQDALTKLDNEYQSKLITEHQQSQNELKLIFNKYELLEKKYNELIEEYNELENQKSQDRTTFIKKIEMLNHELSKREKEFLQANSKRESAESMLSKKEAQIDNIKKIMNDEIEASLRKVQQTNNKYQKLNEDYLQYKIEAEKELALCRQRNEFLTSKLSQINKQKEIGSSKNLQNIDKQKILEMRETIDKFKQESISYESKIQTMKKQHTQLESTLMKKLSQLEKELELSRQRLQLEKTKNNDLEDKITSKHEFFKKELDEINSKYQSERSEHYKLLEQLKKKISTLQDDKNSISWKLQKQVALLNDKLQYAQRQKDEARKELEQSQRRLIILTTQLRKTSEKSSEDQESKKTTLDKRMSQQLETMKVSMKFKTDEQQEEIKKLRDDLKTFKDRNADLQDKLAKLEKSKQSEKTLQEEKENLKREKQELQSLYRTQKAKQIEDWRRKVNQIEKSNKQLMNQNNLYIFELEKHESKFNMEKNSLLEKIKILQDQLEWHRNTTELQRTSSKSRLDHSKRSDFSKYSTGSGFK